MPPTDVVIRRPIVVGRNVFIGMNVFILPGVEIGDDVIIGAGSVVRGVVESDSIMAGNPARKIRTLTGDPERWRARSQAEGASRDKD